MHPGDHVVANIGERPRKLEKSPAPLGRWKAADI